jgi:DNA invertase Pin-like site-specific DNA recombinase
MKRVALYCRVSTVEQHVENQLIQNSATFPRSEGTRLLASTSTEFRA